MRIVPGSRPAKDVLPLLALEDAAGEDRVGDGVLVRACAALESVCAVERQGDGQDVCAVWADWGFWLDVGTSDDMESFFMLTEKHGCCGIWNPPSRDRRV